MGYLRFAEATVAARSGRKSFPYRDDINGLRAVAILAVLGFHAGARGCSGGFVGVDIFFVISGYLICSIIVREMNQGTFSVSRFYERRFKRILPALFMVLLFCMIAALFLLSPLEAQHLGAEIMATASSLSNLHFYHQGNYFDHGGILSPLLMTWSLAVEEQFYIVFPLLMMLLYRRGKQHLFTIVALLCALSFFVSVVCEFKHPEFNFFLLPTRAWELGVGTLLAIWQMTHSERNLTAKESPHSDWMGTLGLLTILGCVFFYSGATRFPGFEALPPVVGTLLLLCSAGGVANKLLALRPLVWVGLISYSLYLWHWPLLSFSAIADSEQTPVHSRVF